MTADLELLMAMVDVELVLFGEPDSEGYLPTVMVMRQVLPSGISMERLLESSFSEQDEVTVESIEDNRAYAVVRSPDWEGAETESLQHYAIIRSGSYAYAVIYTFAGPASEDELDAIFRESAETIRVLEHQ